jgi:SET domain-containing protein
MLLQQSLTLCRCLSKQEKILQGLTTGLDAPLEVREGGIAGRGVFCKEYIPKGSWLCEYKAGLVYPPSERKKHEEIYDLNGEGSYIIESTYAIPNHGRMCWDATRRYNQIGRYMNHAQKPNAELTQPYEVRGKWRIGFVAVRDIHADDEVVWDYGVRGQEWSGCRLVEGVVSGVTVGEEEVPGTSYATGPVQIVRVVI